LVTRAGELEVTTETLSDGATVLHVEGELDMATSGALEEALDAADGGRVVIDLGPCTFLDSSAVRVLVSAARSAEESGRELSLVARDPGILRVLEIAAVDTMLPVHSSVDDAAAR
jgi:anti-sigma B factor antagonist